MLPSHAFVCTKIIDKIDNEICAYSYHQKTDSTTAKIVEPPQDTEITVSDTITAQETWHSVPVIIPVDPAVEVANPEHFEIYVNKPISLPKSAVRTSLKRYLSLSKK